MLRRNFYFSLFLFSYFVFPQGASAYLGTERQVRKVSVSGVKVDSKRMVDFKKSGDIKEKKILGFKESQRELRLKIPMLSEDQLKVRKKALNRRRSQLMSPFAHKKMERVTYLIRRSKLDKAIQLLMRLKKSVQKLPYELAYVYQQLGGVYFQKDQYDLALQFIQQALELESLSKAETLNLMYRLAYLYIMKKDYVKSLSIMNEWFYYNDRPAPNAYVLRANNYYELGYKREALGQVEKALELTRASIPRKKDWLQMGGVINLELKNFSRASELLKELVTYYPKYKVYWIQLTAVYSEMGRNDKALAILEMAYKLGFLSSEGEILNLVSLYLDQGAPLKAAQILDREIQAQKVSAKKRNLEILANSYVQAEETVKALHFYQKAAALSEDGRLYFYLGQMYMDREKWIQANKAFLKALPMGGIKDKGRLYLSLGIVNYKMGKVDLASGFFKRALEKKNTKKSAQEWVQHLEGEKSSSHQESLSPENQNRAL